MNITALVNRSADIITQYYQNNITPFLEAFHDDALWIGPAENRSFEPGIPFGRLSPRKSIPSISFCTI